MPVTMDHIELVDAGFGPHMISVTPPGGSPFAAPLSKNVMGKAPGRWTGTMWVGAKTNDPKHRCPDWKTAETWKNWGAGVGFVVGDGYAVIDNDQGEEFSDVLSDVCFEMGIDPVRRYVDHPTHKRDAFFFRVLDFIGDGAPVTNRSLTFRKGTLVAAVQILGRGLQAVIYGLHKDTHCPYVWNRKIAGPHEIPVISVEDYDELIKKFMGGVNIRGWTLEGPLPQAVRQSVNSPPNSQAANQPVDNSTTCLSEIIAEAKANLDLIPNRIVPAGEKENSVDLYLNIQQNWADIAYRLYGQLGPSVATTPEAEAIWLEWSDGRPQEPTDRSLTVWRSVLKQPDHEYGGLALIKKVRELGALPMEGFPPVPSNDPAFQERSRPLWDAMRERWAFLRGKNGGFFDMRTKNIVMSRQGFSDEHENIAEELAKELGHKKKKSAANLFVSRSDKLILDGLTYAPGEDKLFRDQISPNPFFNHWRAPPVFPNATEKDVKLWLDHVEMIVGPDEVKRFVRWCAFVVQYPKEKPNWHYLVMSEQGTGKDTMIAPLKTAIGKSNVKEEEVYQLESGFNELIETKLLVISEVSQPKYDSHKVANRLKQIMANLPPTFRINEKYLPRYDIFNRLAVIMFSNELQPLQLEQRQRRVHVVNRRDTPPAKSPYYRTLWDWLDQGGLELAAGYLQHLPLTDAERQEFKGVAPESDAKMELEQMSLKPGLDALGEIIEDSRDGTGPFPRLLATAAQLAIEIEQKGVKRPLPQELHGWLMDLERRKMGVRRLRVDPKKPHQCAVIGGGAHGGSARLWALAERHPDGADWKDFTVTEIIALWRNASKPQSAKIIDFPKVKPSEDIV